MRNCALVLAAVLCFAQPSLWSEQVEFTQETILPLLQNGSANNPLPELANADIGQLAARPQGIELLKWAREMSAEMPATTYTLYRQFRKTGERAPYERPYFEKRDQLSRAVLVAWLGADDFALDRINDLIWNICEETTWVAPAHEKRGAWTIDLFAAETGAELAHVAYVLGERLPAEVRDRIHAEVERRIFVPYLEHANDYWWKSGRNNWTGVCAGSIGETFLLLEPDLPRQAQAVALVLGQLNRFIDLGFENDGTCLEGIGYWNYGLLHLVQFAEMLRARTGGAIDLLANEKMKLIAQNPANVCIGKDSFAAFADSHEHATLIPFLAARLSERTGRQELMGLVADSSAGSFSSALRNLLWWDGVRGAQPELTPVFLPASGIARRVGSTAGKPLAVVIKAGHNAEPHNNNDVGSFVLRIGDFTYLCDPGGGFYNKDYFSDKRYENVFANSYGHSVPRIAGTLQPTGAGYRGTMAEAADGSIHIDFAKAYNVPQLTKATRNLALKEDGRVVLEDAFESAAPGVEVEEVFLTWLDVAIEGNTARVTSPEGVLELHSSAGPFAAERLEDACRANHASGTLTRITVTIPAAPAITAPFTFVFKPNG